MDNAEQVAGEKRVRQILIEPLLRRGLARPASLTIAAFEEMVADICARLAYMDAVHLAALEEQAATHAGGKERDRFPIGQRVLEWAAQIQPPGDDASPLIRAVFSNSLGLDALAEGWAPELLAELRQTRRWPVPFAVKTIRDRAEGPVRQLREFEQALARGGELPPSQMQWRDRRIATLARCQRIAQMGSKQAGDAA